MTPQETIAHLQSQLDECRRKRDEAKVKADFWLAHEKQTNVEFERDYLAIWKAVKQPDMTVLNSVLELKGRLANAETALAASQAQVGELQKDKERLDAIPHGWRIGHEAGASGHPDHWYIWTGDWSQPLGEGDTLRAAIDAARTHAQDPKP